MSSHLLPRSLRNLRDSLVWAVQDATGKHGVPPAHLRMKVHGRLDVPSFVAVGESCAQSLFNALASMGIDPYRIATVLDFGCGVGRTLQAFKQLLPTAQFSATDIDAAAVAWCRENLQPATYAVNAALPPLPFDAAQFDLIYAVSVFSHLDEEMQFRWLEELHRVARPGAAVLLSVHGPSAEHILPAAERPFYRERGFWFTRADNWADYFPEFYHTSIHTRDYVEKHWSRFFSVVAYSEKGMDNNQDLVMLRRPASSTTTLPPTPPGESFQQRDPWPADSGQEIWAEPRAISALGNCIFYHTMDIPSYGHVEGQWDLRGDVDGYLGHQDYRGKRVLELGPASGFLTFEMEKRGASVVGFDLPRGEEWDLVPFVSPDLSKEMSEFVHDLDRMKNGFWLAHAAHASRARMVYGNIYDIPLAVGEFDMAMFGLILLHLRDPFGALANVAPLVGERMVITEPAWWAAPPVVTFFQEALNGAPDAARRLNRADAPAVEQLLAHLAAAVQTQLPLQYFLPNSRAAAMNFRTWWSLSPRVVVEFLKVLGFEQTTTTEHTQLFYGKTVPMWTVVGERVGARRIAARGGGEAVSASATPPAVPAVTAAKRHQSAQPGRDPLVPPDHMIMDGDYENYVFVGEHFLEHFVQLGGLRSTHQVLDVGAATGRMARPLTRFLDRTAEYFGLEIVADAVAWAQKEIATRHPNFHFIHADIYNQAYNPGGVQRSREYRFPFADESFDFAFATSVFTHMLPADVQHYLSEIERVLRPGGRLLATFFALTRTARAAMEAGTTGHTFGHQFEGYSALEPTCPEAALAYEENDFRRLYRNAGLTIIEPLWPGSWTGLRKSKTYQDIVVATKPVGERR